VRKRLLLPFTHGVDGKAIDHVLLFAKGADTIIITLALIPVIPKTEEVRPERIQQAKDFLEMIYAKSINYGVLLEKYEIFANNILETTLASVSTMDCQGIILLFEGEEAKFLHTNEANYIRQHTTHSLYILQMLTHKRPSILKNFLPQLAGKLTRKTQ